MEQSLVDNKIKRWSKISKSNLMMTPDETEKMDKIENEFLLLVIEMRKAQQALSFGRKPSAYDRKNAAEKKVDDYILKLVRGGQ